MVQQGKLRQAVEAYERLIQHYEKAEIKHSMANIHFNLGVTLKRLGRQQQATEQFVKAAEEFRAELVENPGEAELLWTRLGTTHATMGDFKAASEAFRKALALNPGNLTAYDNLAKTLEFQGRYDEAIDVLRKGVQFMQRHGQKAAAAMLQRDLEFLEFKKIAPETK